MNRRQGAVLVIGLAGLLGMAAYCPWHVVEPLMPGPPVVTPGGVVIGGVGENRDATVYTWCWEPPVPRLQPATVQVDWGRLTLQAAGLGAVTGAGVWLLRRPPSHPSEA